MRRTEAVLAGAEAVLAAAPVAPDAAAIPRTAKAEMMMAVVLRFTTCLPC